MSTYDVGIIGGGPGGYVAAIKAAQLGGSVCLIEKEQWGWHLSEPRVHPNENPFRGRQSRNADSGSIYFRCAYRWGDSN